MEELKKENARLHLTVIQLHKTLDDMLLKEIIVNPYCSTETAVKLVEEQKSKNYHWGQQKD